MLMSVQEPSCMDCFIPRKYRDPEIYQQKMEKYENMLLDETMKPFINSGHAFVSFDSVNSLNTIVKHFRMTPSQHVKVFFLGVKDKIVKFIAWISGKDTNSQHQIFDSRGRARSNFLRSSENADLLAPDYGNASHVLIMHKASEPLDILWKNMGVIETHFAFTRFFLFIGGFIMIVFLSSPAVMLTRL
jgi:hypothetical protein